jgi:single-stranded DNA-binding protein
VGFFILKPLQMKNYKNKVLLIGSFLNPQFITQDNGFKYVKFRIITQESYLAQDGVKSKDEMYHVCYAYGKQFDILERFVSIGGELAVEGILINRSLLIGHEESVETSIHVSDLLILNNRN